MFGRKGKKCQTSIYNTTTKKIKDRATRIPLKTEGEGKVIINTHVLSSYTYDGIGYVFSLSTKYTSLRLTSHVVELQQYNYLRQGQKAHRHSFQRYAGLQHHN